MKEKELKSIIDREKHVSDVRQFYSKQIELMTDLVNYGSNLIVRVFDSSDKKIVDMVAIGVLLKQVVQMIDAAQVLVTAGSIRAAFLQVRAAFEAELCMLWILNGESENKARYYFVAGVRKQRLWALRMTPDTLERANYLKVFGELPDYSKHEDEENVISLAKSQLVKFNEFLQTPEYRDINESFEKKCKNGNETEWYKVLGVSSVRKLAEKVDKLPEYDLFYARSSEIMHGANYQDHIRLIGLNVRFEPIRQLKDINQLIIFSSSVAIGSYGEILKHYRHGELEQFRKKYVNDWREAFLNVQPVKYNYGKRPST